MVKEEIIRNVSNLVQDQCKKESNIFGYEIWTHHIIVVVKYAKLLAKKLEADIEIVEISALLHDYASIKDKSMYDEHHIYGAIEAEQILNKLDYPKEKINMIKECIISHRGSLNIKRVTKEEICIASADAMAHIDQIPSLLHLAYCKRKMSVDEGAIWVSDKIERSWNKLCLEAKEIIREKYVSGKSTLIGQVKFINEI